MFMNDLFVNEIADFIEKNTGLDKSEIKKSVEKPKSSDMGDIAFPCFILSKQLKKSPNDIASDLQNKFEKSKSIKDVKAVGPYLNFFVDNEFFAESILKDIMKKKDKYGRNADKKKKVMVEYCSPNTNKSLHLGHVRNCVLGKSVSNILEFDGFDVVTVVVNNDRGVGVCEAMLGYEMFHKGEAPNIKPDHFVAQCYVDFKKAAEKDPELNKKSQQMLVDWESGKPDVIKLWNKIVKWVYDGYFDTYKLLDIRFDKEYFESELYKFGKDIVEKGLKEGIFVKEDGAVVAKLEKYGLPDKVLLKSDGTALYMTQDLYLALKKFDDFKIDYSIYVVMSEQDLHFKQLFKILELLGYDFAKNCYHLSYGMVNLPSGRMKSREGNVVDADDLIEEVTKIAKVEIIQRHKDISKKELDFRSKAIALAAIKFFMVKIDPVKDFTFNPEESIAFEGETGPYLQYAHARCCSVLKKYGKKVSVDVDFSNFKNSEKLLSVLSEFNNVIADSGYRYKPSLLAHYLIDVAQEFSNFYNDNPIISDDKKLTEYRILLSACVKQVLNNGLTLLAIEPLEEM
jgi:arginyl-tRNA synthetase